MVALAHDDPGRRALPPPPPLTSSGSLWYRSRSNNGIFAFVFCQLDHALTQKKYKTKISIHDELTMTLAAIAIVKETTRNVSSSMAIKTLNKKHNVNSEISTAIFAHLINEHDEESQEIAAAPFQGSIVGEGKNGATFRPQIIYRRNGTCRPILSLALFAWDWERLYR
jgi:hypothetical protein